MTGKPVRRWVCGWAASYTDRGVPSPIFPCTARFPHRTDWRCGDSYAEEKPPEPRLAGYKDV